MTIRPNRAWLAGFTAVFAALAAYVFWGTWSPDVAPVMPDDSVWHPLAYSGQLRHAVREWLSNGSFVPTLFFWNGVFPQYWVQELKYVVCLYCAGLGLAYFLRGRGLSYLASYGSGLFLGFCGYWSTLFSAGHGTWFLLMASFVPAFGFLDRAIVHGKIRHWILLGASVAWGSCYQPDIFLLLSILLVSYGIYACFRERKFPWKGALVALVALAVVGAPGIRGAFANALVARAKQIDDSMGSALTGGKGKDLTGKSDAEKAKELDDARWIFVTNWSMAPEDTLEFFIPRIHGDTSCPMTLQLGRMAGKDVRPYTGRLGRPINAPSGNYRQHSLYVGWMTCLLALCCVFVMRGRRSDVVFFFCAAVVMYLCSLGRFCEPVYRVVYHLPFGPYLRGPVKWHHVTEFCLCALAGFGLESLVGWLRERGLARKTAFAIGAALVIVGAVDLARNDSLFCVPIDLHVVTGRNAAAEDVLRRGDGKVCDLLEGGGGLISWSFAAHDVSMNSELSSNETRFVFVANETVKQRRDIAGWLKAKATPIGTYAVARDGIRRTAPASSNVSLYQVNGVPPPAKPEDPPVDDLVLTLGIVSLLATLGIFLMIAFKWRRRTEQCVF